MRSDSATERDSIYDRELGICPARDSHGALMDLVTTALLKEFSKEYELESFPEDKQFEIMASYLTARLSYSETFNPQDIVVGSGGDLGIDAVAIVVNGSLYTDIESLKELLSTNVDYVDATFVFTQSERSNSFDAAKLGNFVYGVEQFFDIGTKEPRNDRIKEYMEMMSLIYEKGSKFKKGNPVCRLYYITTGKWPDTGALPIRREKFTNDLLGLNTFRDVHIEPIGASDLSELYRLSKHAIYRTFTFSGREEIPEIAGVKEAFIGFIPASEFLSIVKGNQGEIVKSLFYDNVRDFQGYNPVNNEIKETLSSERRARFVLMNNGVTIITRGLAHTRDKFTIEDFQIVNGCQTTHVLFDNNEHLDDSVLVPLRLIWTQDEKVIEDIIHATNRQTEVSRDQFFAITDFARHLEDYFKSWEESKRLYFERRSRQYDSLEIEKTRIINQINAVRSFAAAFLEEPHRTVRGYRSLADRVGKDIFVDGHKLIAYYTSSFALYRLEGLFNNGQIDPTYKIARYQLLMAARVLANSESLPQLNARKMDEFCEKILDDLWDKKKALKLFTKALDAVKSVTGGTLDRDTIHTQAFSQKLKEYCKGAASAKGQR